MLKSSIDPRKSKPRHEASGRHRSRHDRAVPRRNSAAPLTNSPERVSVHPLGNHSGRHAGRRSKENAGSRLTIEYSPRDVAAVPLFRGIAAAARGKQARRGGRDVVGKVGLVVDQEHPRGAPRRIRLAIETVVVDVTLVSGTKGIATRSGWSAHDVGVAIVLLFILTYYFLSVVDEFGEALVGTLRKRLLPKYPYANAGWLSWGPYATQGGVTLVVCVCLVVSGVVSARPASSLRQSGGHFAAAPDDGSLPNFSPPPAPRPHSKGPTVHPSPSKRPQPPRPAPSVSTPPPRSGPVVAVVDCGEGSMPEGGQCVPEAGVTEGAWPCDKGYQDVGGQCVKEVGTESGRSDRP